MTNNDFTRRDAAVKCAIDYINRRARTEFQVRQQLVKKGFLQEEIQYAVDRLKEGLLLGDQKYAELFIDSRLATKPISRRELFNQLIKNGVAQETIASALEAVTDDMEQENAYALSCKFIRAYTGLATADCFNKTVRRLISRGYSYEHSKNATQLAIQTLRLESTQEYDT